MAAGDLIQWLAPTTYDCNHFEQDLEDARSIRHPGTCKWIEPKPLFQSWRTSKLGSDSSVLWIYAIPGAGKTVLASYLVDQARTMEHPTPNCHSIMYFFCKNADADKNCPLAIARALVYQLLRSPRLAKRQELIGDLKLHKTAGGQSRAVSFRPLWNILCKYCRDLPDAIIILDALDECSDTHLLIPGLLKLAHQGSAKVVITSRREPELVGAIERVPSVAIGAEDLRDDIKAYLEYQVSQSSMLSDPRVRSRIVRVLSVRSKGMFLWVALMLKELESRSTIDEIESALSSLPDGLNEVYERILTRLHNTLKPSRRMFCCRLLKWITLAKRPLRLDEVGEALKLEYATATGDSSFTQNLLCSVRELELVCGSLVTVKNQSIQLIHLSTREFLLTPGESLPLRHTLHAFLVRWAEDSALLASICVMLISPHCVPGKLSRDSAGRLLGLKVPLLDYACFHWISHLVESQPEAVIQHQPKIQRFLESRQSFCWIEMCFTVQRGVCSQLNMVLQSLLDWLPYDPSQKIQSQSLQKPPVPLLQYWAKSYLQLLADYGPVLETRPYEIHNIDPERIFRQSCHGVLELFSRDSSYDRHIVLEDSQTSSIVPNIPEHRVLQRHTSPDNKYACFFFDRRRGAFLAIDMAATNTPRIFCQEVATGRRLPSVSDTEFGDELDSLEAQGASLSSDGRYLGILYIHRRKSLGDVNTRVSLYTAIWLLPETLDFSASGPTLWARKVISTSMEVLLGNCSAHPIVFGNDGLLYCAYGRVDPASGVEEEIFGEFDIREQYNIMFSGDGQTAVCFRDHAHVLEYVSFEGDTKTIYRYDSGTVLAPGALSHTGRFLTWHELRNEQGAWVESLRVYDKHSCALNELEKPLAHSYTKIQFLFTKNEESLLGVASAYGELNHKITHILNWKWHDPAFRFWGVKTIRGDLSGFYFDEHEQHLYVVSEERIWSRLDLADKEMRNLDSELSEGQHVRVEHRVSQDGKQMAILRQNAMKWVLVIV